MKIIQVDSCSECPYYDYNKNHCDYSDLPFEEMGNCDGFFPEKCELTDPSKPRYIEVPR